MFATPQEMTKEYMRHLLINRSDYIADEIQEYKAQAIKMLYKVVDPFFAQAIAVTIACAYETGLTKR